MKHLAGLSVLILVAVSIIPCESRTKYRLCVVENEKNKKLIKAHCDTLNKDDSKAECVLGSSRIDCLRKISQEKADFTVLQAEDLLVAPLATTNNRNRLLIINHIRSFPKEPFEYQVVPIVRKSANITRISDLKGKRVCLPGFSHDDGDWTDVTARYFEKKVAPQLCEPNLTLVENRIKSSSEYFEKACLAGMWVQDMKLDRELKMKYPNLCALCDNPEECSTMDKYWGRTGPLLCLTDGIGDVAWVREDDIARDFHLSTRDYNAARAEQYSLLCVDDTTEPVAKSLGCPWLAQPWSAVTANGRFASQIQKMVSGLKNAEEHSWREALLHLMESYFQAIVPLDSLLTPDDYLASAPGFPSAETPLQCHPAHTIQICTRSNIENSKCRWLKNTASAYGVEPEIDCFQAESTEDCLKAVREGNADVVTLKSDDYHRAVVKYGLKALLFEFPHKKHDLYNVAAVVKTDSKIKTLEDLRGAKACFTQYDGVGWNSIIDRLQENSLLSSDCPYTKAVGDFFSESCVPRIQNFEKDYPENLITLCKYKSQLAPNPHVKDCCENDGDDVFGGEIGAFHCLASGQGDVAFINLNTLLKNTDGASSDPRTSHLKSKDFRPVCLNDGTDLCNISWATLGQVMVNPNISWVKEEEIYTTFLTLENLFGKKLKSVTPPFELFRMFDNQSNVLFQDETEKLDTFEALPEHGPREYNYEAMIKTMPVCSSASVANLSIVVLLTTLMRCRY